MIGVVELVLAFLTPGVMDTLGNMYAFGATFGYTLVFISLIRLRFSDPYSPRPYRMPLNLSGEASRARRSTCRFSVSSACWE